MNIERHSPSSLNLFCASPAMFVLERVLGRKQPVGAPAHRGTAVEAGIAAGLLTGMDEGDCIAEAMQVYHMKTALSGDHRVLSYGADIPAMVKAGLEELRPYGVPSATQGFVEWRPEGLKLPIVGYFDFEWKDHGLIVDLKTTAALPSAIKTGHARQVALYTGGNMEGRLAYVTPKRRATYRLENVSEHRTALHKIALTVERFLALSNDPQELAGLVCPDLESFYWNTSEARAAAYTQWGV